MLGRWGITGMGAVVWGAGGDRAGMFDSPPATAWVRFSYSGTDQSRVRLSIIVGWVLLGARCCDIE